MISNAYWLRHIAEKHPLHLNADERRVIEGCARRIEGYELLVAEVQQSLLNARDHGYYTPTRIGPVRTGARN